MEELLGAFGNVFQVIGKLFAENKGFWLAVIGLFAWAAWWLWAVNWKKAWPVLAQGGWAPLVLLMLISALVWSRLAPTDDGTFWWHLGGVSIYVGIAFFCGWLQGYFGCTPPEISLEPPAHADHGHGHH